MSSIGTGIATGVAAVAQTAQQTARAKDKARSTSHRVADANRDEFVERLQSAAAAGDPDAELPDHQAPGYEQLYLHDGDGEPIAFQSAPAPELHPEPEAYGPTPAPIHPLYQHLDIQA